MKNIKGKMYVEVSERVSEFRTNEKYTGWSLTTEILDHQNGMIIMKATAKNELDRIISEGTAYEVNEAQGSNMINLTSYIENCETSAIGRCLGFLDIGLNGSIASADEVTNAITQQESNGRTVSTNAYNDNGNTNNAHREQPVKTDKEFDIKWWSGEGQIAQFEHFMVGDIEYKTMKNKTSGELFGLAVDESVAYDQKFYKFV